MAVQRHPGLQAQGVAAGQTARDQPGPGSGLGQREPQLLGVGGGDEQLEAVLAGVAGAGDQRGDARDRAGQTGVVLQAVEVGVGQRLEDAGGLGALHGEQRVGVTVVAYDRVEAVAPLGERVQHDLGVGGVGDHHVLGFGEPVDDQVVQDAAVGPADHGVAGAAEAHRGDVADEGVVEELGGLGSGDGDLAHVGEVEEAGLRADGEVLVAL